MQFPRSGLICAILVASSACVVLVKVRAQISETTPFTAIETHITRSTDLKVPTAFVTVLAVSSDGLIATLLERPVLVWPPVYLRTVWNQREKTEISIDPEAKMLVVHMYRESDLSSRPNCDGTPDGQIEGFDVYRTEPKVGEDPSNPGRTTTKKRWAAPKLGCYILRDEEVTTDKHGKFVSSNIHILTDVKIGEPDPSYFDTSLPKGYSQVLPDDWKEEYIRRMKAHGAKQGQ